MFGEVLGIKTQALISFGFEGLRWWARSEHLKVCMTILDVEFNGPYTIYIGIHAEPLL